MTSQKHNTTEGGWGPGTFVDTAFHSVPEESRRIMRLIASRTPGLTLDESALSEVEFSGADLSLIPGPLKSQAVVCKIMKSIDANGIAEHFKSQLLCMD